MRSLTTTSFAILGWLEVRPWTSYELARQMSRNLAFFWPRVESRIYDEPKNLVEQGLATVEASYVGKRRRRTYSITDQGRRALQEWQGLPPELPSLEFDGLVHLFFGRSASPEQLAGSVATATRLADLIEEQGRQVGGQYLSGSYPFPERAHLSGLTFDFLWSLAELLRSWAERSQAEIATWNDTAPSEAKRARAFEIYRTALARNPDANGTDTTSR